jgi:polar amino acid transport system permease protein
MQKSNDQNRFAKPASYKLWVGVFWLLVLLVAGGFYYATQKIAYTWRWNRVPIYFAYKDTIEIISDIDGKVESITKSGKDALITVKGAEEKDSYAVPADSKMVDKGYYVYAGETLASYT